MEFTYLFTMLFATDSKKKSRFSKLLCFWKKHAEMASTTNELVATIYTRCYHKCEKPDLFLTRLKKQGMKFVSKLVSVVLVS